MSRRRIVLVVSLALVVAAFVIATAAVFVLTQSGWGQNQIRRIVQAQLAGAVHGTVYVGRPTGSYLTGLTFDSLEIRDAEDSLFLATGRVTVAYDPRDLIDKRLLFSRVDVNDAVVYLRQHENWDWNFQRIFRHGRQGPKATGPQFGDYVVLDSVTLHNATFELSQPWHPDDSLRGARRDSAIRVNVADPSRRVFRTREGYVHTRKWTHINAELPLVRIADPDSAGRVFRIAGLSVNEQEPPFDFRNVRGTVRNLGDTVWIALGHFDLPASTGSGSGRVVWGSDLPIRWNLHIVGDSVALADVGWVYPTLPRAGGGSVVLDIRNERDLHVVDYKLTKLDVRSERSHLVGAMTFAVGAPVLGVRDVNLRAEPVNFDLLRTLNGKPLPVDWQGDLRGTVVARGGPLTHFVVDTSHLTFRDAHVKGAVSTMTGRGELDILEPAFTAFHHFNVASSGIDLRTIQYLYPNFPRLVGTASGAATLDSSWLDVRFSNADVSLNTPGAPRSRLLGSGRVTVGDTVMTYDASLFADSLSLTALDRSYPKLPVRGLYSGTIRAQGTVENLYLNASLHGPAGSFTYDGHVDAFPPGYGVHGSGRITAADPAAMLVAANVPAGSLNGSYDVDLTGDSLANLAGAASAALERSEFDGVHLFGSRARVRFDGGRVRVDTLRLETSAATVTASGGLGLQPGVVDTLNYDASVDSLGGLRPFLQTDAAIKSGKPDSLAGALAVTGFLTGNIDSLNVRGDLFGSSLYRNKDRGAAARGRVSVDNVLGTPRGTVAFELDTLVLAGVRVDTIGAEVELATRTRGTFRLGALSDNGPTFAAAGLVAHDSTQWAFDVRSVNVDLGASRWALAKPGAVRIAPALTTVDTLRLTNGHGGSVLVAGRVPLADSVRLRFHADSVPVRDAATLLQIADTMSGWGAFHVDVAGTRDHPRAVAEMMLSRLRYGGMRLDRVGLNAAYADRKTSAAVEVFGNGTPTLQATASLPMEITLTGAPRLLPDSLHGQIRADSADLAIVEAFVPTVTRARGRVFVALDVGGTWDHPSVGGRVRMSGGEMTMSDLGITLRDISADLAVSEQRDSLAVRSLRARSSGGAGDTIAVHGFVDFADRANPLFNLRLTARDFRVMDKRSLARLDVSTVGSGITLSGRKTSSTLSGSLNIVRGIVYIPESAAAGKQVVPLTYADLAGIVDTSELNTRIKLPSPPSALLRDMTITNVRVTLGDEVWLRSQEANIKLGGSLNVRRSAVRATGPGSPFSSERADSLTYRLALDGTLTAERGTYTLAFGPIQREFQVQSGSITFYGDPELNPKIDVSAAYQVRQYNRPDIKVVAKLSGYLYPGPSLDLESGENYAIPQSDLVSYLCCGVPSFELGANQTYLQTAAQVLLPTASSVLAQTLRGQVGSAVDMLQFQPGATDLSAVPGQTTGSATREFFAGTRVGGDKQITRNVFFSISTGLCQLGPSQPSGSAGAYTFLEQLESKLQYRFSPTLSADVGLEPPSSALLCGRSQRGLVPTPQQWGFSLSKTWRW
ncbi:MAG: translocation/assembly module TamB domain-containing protein [Gemmatimonadota bacterium]|nr:translocation/assembly module TamB domain-containing protein [Gemmatimonadota bacterium]